MPGFEIFFTDKVTWELDEGKAKMIYQWEESGILTWYPEKKEEKAVESEIEEEYQLQLMFTQDGAAGEQGMVSMIIADPVAKDPSTLIIPADGAPRNWSSLPQRKSVSVLSEPVLVKSVESLFNVTSSEDGLKSVPNNDVSVPSVSVIISEVESALEARESVIKELVVCNEMKSRLLVDLKRAG